MRKRIRILICLSICLLVTSCNKNPMSLIPANEQYQLMTERPQPYNTQAHGDSSHQSLSQRIDQLKMQSVEASANKGANKSLLLQYHPRQQKLDSTQQQQLTAFIKTDQANLFTQANIIGGPRGDKPGIGSAYQAEKRMQGIAQVFQLNNIATHIYYDPNLPSDTVNVTLLQDKTPRK